MTCLARQQPFKRTSIAIEIRLVRRALPIRSQSTRDCLLRSLNLKPLLVSNRVHRRRRPGNLEHYCNVRKVVSRESLKYDWSYSRYPGMSQFARRLETTAAGTLQQQPWTRTTPWQSEEGAKLVGIMFLGECRPDFQAKLTRLAA